MLSSAVALSETLCYSCCLFKAPPPPKPSLLWLVGSHKSEAALLTVSPVGFVMFSASSWLHFSHEHRHKLSRGGTTDEQCFHSGLFDFHDLLDAPVRCRFQMILIEGAFRKTILFLSTAVCRMHNNELIYHLGL